MIRYYNENVTFSLSGKRFNNRWLKAVAESENFSIGDMSIIYCSDSYILNMNRRFLKHDYYTDIIAQDYDLRPNSVFITAYLIRCLLGI